MLTYAPEDTAATERQLLARVRIAADRYVRASHKYTLDPTAKRQRKLSLRREELAAARAALSSTDASRPSTRRDLTYSGL